MTAGLEFRAPPPAQDKLDRIVTLAEEMARVEVELLANEKRGKELAQELERLQLRALPDALDDANMKDFTLKDGRKIGIAEEVYSGIAKARQAEAFAWLRAHGFDSIIKRTIAVKFGKGDDSTATATLAALQKLLGGKYELIDAEAVHPQTLGAFVRECLRDGTEIPEATFGVHRVNRAKFTTTIPEHRSDGQ